MEALFEFIAFSFLLILDFAVKYGIQYSNKEVLSQETKDIGLEQQQNISVDCEKNDETFYNTSNESSQIHPSDPEMSDSSVTDEECSNKFLDNANISTVSNQNVELIVPVTENEAASNINNANISTVTNQDVFAPVVENDEASNNNSDNEWDIVNEKEVSANQSHEDIDQTVHEIKLIKYDSDSKWIADGKEFDIKENVPKLSLQNRLDVDGDCYALAILIPVLYELKLKEINIYDQLLTLKQFQEVTSSGKITVLNIQSSKITESDGSLVTVDKIISNQHNLEDIHIDCSPSNVSFTPYTVSKMVVALHRLKNLQHFHLSGLTDNFKFSAIINFLMKNYTVDVFLVFDQFYNFSHAYKKEIEYFMNLAIKNPPKKIPIIEFPGIYQTEIYQKYELL